MTGCAAVTGIGVGAGRDDAAGTDFTLVADAAKIFARIVGVAFVFVRIVGADEIFFSAGI